MISVDQILWAVGVALGLIVIPTVVSWLNDLNFREPKSVKISLTVRQNSAGERVISQGHNEPDPTRSNRDSKENQK
jgi:hypothetical protein